MSERSVAALMMVRNEADIVEQTIRRLLSEDVDLIQVYDNMSDDGTRRILNSLADSYPKLRVGTDPEPGYWQARKMTGWARELAREGHRWLVPVDADEVWKTTTGRALGPTLLDLPEEVGLVNAEVINHYVTGRDESELDDPNPLTRIRWRCAHALTLPKVAVRLHPAVEVRAGNHSAQPPRTAPGTVQGLLEVRHFPYRSEAQFVAKARQGAAAINATTLSEGTCGHWRMYGDAIDRAGEQAAIDHYLHHFTYPDPERDGLTRREDMSRVVYDPA